MNDDIRESLQSALGTQYTLGRELGGGGMSRVYVARDETLGRDVVVKVLSPTIAQEFSVERFTREIRLAANLQHAHIVPLLSAGATTIGLPYYLMPFVEGESLRHRMAAGVGLAIDEVVLVLKDVSRALAYAHARGVVHRDIKPDNVMLSGGAAVVTDFGIAKAVTSAREETAASNGSSEDSLTRMGTSLGTPAYMAPEQGAGDPDTDHRADIYALGAMAYELLTGVTPFGQRPPHALLVAHFTETPAPIETKRPDAPPALSALVMRCLAKDPANRPQTAGEVLAALSDASGTGATTAPAAARVAASPPADGAARRFPSRTLAISLVSAAVLAAAAFAGWRYLRTDAPGMDATLVAVMPFNVRDNALSVWREGLVDVLSRSLDGAGALRSVAPSTVIGKAPARADAASATTLGKDVGAGLVLFGDLSAIGRDSVRLRAAIFDVASGKVRSDIDVRGEGARMDALADSLSLRVLRELSGTVGGSRLYTVGTRSLPALKAFLQGQQLYRRAHSDSALNAYRAAVEYDSTFALAWRGVASVYIRTGRENEPAAQQALDQAIRYKGGRSPRDSMMLRADSLRLSFVRRQPGKVDALEAIPILPPLFATLRDATTQYPSDAELWYEYGDAIFHFGEFAGVPQSNALIAFERGIALDSTFLMPYSHASTVALRDGNTALASRFAARMATILGPEIRPYYRLTSEVLAAPPPFSSEARRLLDSLPGRYAAALIRELATSPDSAARGMGLARLMQERPSPVANPADSSQLHDAVALALAARGRFKDAMASRRGPLPPALYFQLARLGAVPRDSALDRARRWIRGEPARALPAARLLAEAGDTASIDVLVSFMDSVETAARPPVPGGQMVRQSKVLRAYRLLARGDSAGALRALLAIPMTECSSGVPCAGGLVAALLEKQGRDQEAIRVLDRWLPAASTSITTPQELLLRARLAEKLGDEPRAAAAYRTVVALWSGGDPETGPALKEAQEGLQRTAGR